MNSFIKSFAPIIKRCRKYLIEIVLISLALIIAIVSLALYLKNSQNNEEDIDISSTRLRQDFGGQAKIYLDIAGAVNKPGLYQLASGSRLNDAIKIAGNLSDDADKDFFARNFNLARIVSDQEKIYVPSVWEIKNGYFSVINHAPTTTTDLININSAAIDELDTLPGVGQVTSQKIIENRPYQSIDELLNKKVINKSVFEKIKGLITVN